MACFLLKGRLFFLGGPQRPSQAWTLEDRRSHTVTQGAGEGEWGELKEEVGRPRRAKPPNHLLTQSSADLARQRGHTRAAAASRLAKAFFSFSTC